MGYDNSEVLNNEMNEITCHFLQIIRERYEKSDSGKIRGYLLMNETGDLLTKKELRKIQIREDDENPPPYLGRSMCCDPDPDRRTLNNFLIAYNINNELRAELKKYNFKKLSLLFFHVNEYRYYKDKFWKIRKTEYEIPLMEVKIDW